MKFLYFFLALVTGLSAVSLRDQIYSGKVEEKLVRLRDVWKDCSKPDDPMNVTAVTITPDPPQKGKDFVASANVTTLETISGGNLHIKIKYGIFPVKTEDHDICDVFKDGGSSCPLSPGSHSFKLTASIPGSAPSGHYTGSVEGTDQDGKELLCANLDFHL